jgi:uncharacterized phage infection (PIP) family protein YhgE
MNDNRVLVAPRTWLMPIILLVGLAVALPAVYLGATANPQGNLADLPIALVVESQVGASGAPASAEKVADAIEGNAQDTLAFTRMTSNELYTAMREDRVAGAVIIPANFDASVASLLPGSTNVSIPTVRIATNAGDGGLSNGLVLGNVTPLIQSVANGFGKQLTSTTPLAPANAALLAEPFHVEAAPFQPLPDNSGLGTSAFYYSLILVLIAFIGASLVNPLVDSALGVVPSEIGPLITRQPYTAVTRTRTFVAKAVILAIASPLAAAALQGMAAAIGVTSARSVELWLFSTAVIAAIGTSALAIFAVLGPGIGSLVNTLFFVALAMVSSGGIVPLEATPALFRLISEISPFRHVIDGARSLFYFDGNVAAGLGEAWLSIAIGGSIGLILGLAVTTLYGRIGRFSRHPRATTN